MSLRRGMVFVQKPFSKPSRDITSILKCLTPTRITPLVSEAEERRNILNPLCIVKGKVAFQIPAGRFRKRCNHRLYKLTGVISEHSEVRFIEALLTQAHNCFRLYLFVILQHRVVVAR